MKEDYDQIVKFEKAIEKKYGSKAIINPKSTWNKEKEKKFINDLKGFYNKRASSQSERIRHGDILISKAFYQEESQNECPVCGAYSMSQRDDVYMSKYDCCMKCYFDYIDGREERWQTGWRPEKKDLKAKTT